MVPSKQSFPDGPPPQPPIAPFRSSGARVFSVSEPDPDWDGSYVNVIDPSAADSRPLAVVEFDQCYVYQFGGPNDEVFQGHRLAGRGLWGYGAYLVENSKWIREMMTINSVHRLYDESLWTDYRHYFLAFRDECFECIAINHRVEQMARFEGTFASGPEVDTPASECGAIVRDGLPIRPHLRKTPQPKA